MKKLCIWLLTFFTVHTSYGQTISGIVTDISTNEALIGVNIITNDRKGTATNIDGKYSLELTGGNHKIFRY